MSASQGRRERKPGDGRGRRAGVAGSDDWRRQGHYRMTGEEWLSETDALGHSTSYTYDALGRRTSTTDANGDTVTYDFDTLGRLIRVTDAEPEGNVTEFVYNDMNRLVKETQYFDEVVEQSRAYQYEVEGLRTKVIDRRGWDRTFDYDELHRLRHEYWHGDGGSLENTVTYTYDVLHRLVDAADDFSHYTYHHDALDRLTLEEVRNPGLPAVDLTTGYGTRLDGLRTSLSATVGGTADFTNTYGYDGLLRTTDVTQSGPGVAPKHVHFDYTDTSRFDLITRYASTGTSDLVATTDYTYDGQERLTALTHYQTPGTPLNDYTWTFDAGGRLVQQTSNDGTVDYSYDSRGQVVGADYVGDWQDDETYDYDANGNREEANGATYAIGDHNRMTFDGTYTYTYDAEGNRTARFATRAALAGRLVLATVHARDAAAAIEGMHYLSVPYYVLGGALRLVIAQDLIRRVCRACARPRALAAHEMALFEQVGLAPPEHVQDAVGCPECFGYGYHGRTGVFQVAPVDDELGNWLAAGRRQQEIRERLLASGSRPLVADALEKASAGVTSMSEVLRFYGQGIDRPLAVRPEPAKVVDSARPERAR